MIDLINQLEKAYNGDTWHGSNTLNLLSKANPSKVFAHPIAAAHSVAEITLHLTSWTLEVADRIDGLAAKEPTAGDWTQPKEQSTKEWKIILEDFQAANEKLLQKLKALQADHWNMLVKDERNNELGTDINNAELVNGLIQHHAYHSGQIAILLKF